MWFLEMLALAEVKWGSIVCGQRFPSHFTAISLPPGLSIQRAAPRYQKHNSTVIY